MPVFHRMRETARSRCRAGNRVLEALWYEASPYVYVALGAVSGTVSHSDRGLLSSALLLVASLAILRMRRLYRSPERKQLRKYARPR